MNRRRALVLGVAEARNRFGEILRRVRRGGEVTITRRGVPVVKFVPISTSKPKSRRSIREAIDRWERTSKGINLEGLKIKDLIGQGRS